jgi:acetyl esterase/lipase
MNWSIRRTVVLAAGLAGLLALAPGAEGSADPLAPLSGVKVQRGITYSTVNGVRLQLDIAIPPGEGPFPCLVLFHGGAWEFGNRKDLSVGVKEKSGQLQPSWIQTLAGKGYVAASVSYRLAPKYKFPAMIEDARSAVRFLRANAGTFHIDPERIGAGGFSAGAHLAMLVGYCDRSAGFDVGDNLNVSGRAKCVVDFFGPTNLSLYNDSPGLVDTYLVQVFGKECKTNPSILEKASPLTYVSRDSPPTLILQGTIDLIVPILHSELLQKALTRDGVPNEMFTIPFAGHGRWNKSDMSRAELAAFKFLDQYLKGKR